MIWRYGINTRKITLDLLVVCTYFGVKNYKYNYPLPTSHSTTAKHILHSPNTTSAITYKVQVAASNASNLMYFGHDANLSSITLMEIAG